MSGKRGRKTKKEEEKRRRGRGGDFLEEEKKKKCRERERSIKNRGIGEEGFAPFCFIFVGVTDLNILMLNS